MKKALSGRRSTLWRTEQRGFWETPRNHCNITFEISFFQSNSKDLSENKESPILFFCCCFFTSDPPLQQIATSRRWDRGRRLWWRILALWRQVTKWHTVETRASVFSDNCFRVNCWLAFLRTTSRDGGSVTNLQGTSSGHSLVSI